MKKKIILFLLLISTISLLFIGCGDDRNNDVQKPITVSFQVRGGNPIENFQVSSDEVVELPQATRENYVFFGWYASTEWINKIDNVSYFDKNTILFARWADERTITLTSNNFDKYLTIFATYPYLVNNTYETINVSCKLLEYYPEELLSIGHVEVRIGISQINKWSDLFSGDFSHNPIEEIVAKDIRDYYNKLTNSISTGIDYSLPMPLQLIVSGHFKAVMPEGYVPL